MTIAALALGIVALGGACFAFDRLREIGDCYMIAAGWPLAIDLLGEAILAVGFCGYMARAVRPDVYYRRRLPAV